MTVAFARIVVAMLLVGVIAVATDAQALVCEFVCTTQRSGTTASHTHSAFENPQPSAAAPHKHEGHMGHADMHHASQSPEPSSPGQLEQCVTVDDVTLRATMIRDVVHPPGVTGHATGITAARTVDSPVYAAITGSPPARNGPLQLSSILRI
jgi:hypothetical protein